MTRKRTIVIVVALAVALGVGLSIPLASGYAGWSYQGVMRSLSGSSQHPYYGGGMMGGYGGGMMGSYYDNNGAPGYGPGMMGAFYNGTYGYGPNMMSGFYNGSYYGGMMTIQGQSVPIGQAVQSASSSPSYAQIIKSNDTVSFHSQSITITALAIMPDQAVNLTGASLPSYSTGDVFVIYGLINPTLVIPSGATVQFNIVNLDTDMYHNLVVSSTSPPYPYMAMQGMMTAFYSQTQSSNTFASMMGFLPPANYSSGTAQEYAYSFTFNQTGTMWYLCTYPGHAQSGMYGQIIIS